MSLVLKAAHSSLNWAFYVIASVCVAIYEIIYLKISLALEAWNIIEYNSSEMQQRNCRTRRNEPGQTV